MNRFKRISYGFLSANLRGSLIYEDVRKVTLINLFSIIGIFYLLFYSFRMFKLHDYKLSYVYICCILIIVSMQFFLNLRKKIVAVSHVLVFGLYCLEVLFLVRNGSTMLNIKSHYIFPGIYWYYVFPPFSIFLLGRKIGSLYNLLLIGTSIIYFSFSCFQNEYYDFEFIVRFLSIFSAIFFFSFFFESVRVITSDAYRTSQNKNIKLLKLISEKNSNLKKNNSELSQLTEEISTQMEYLKVLNVELQEQNEKIAKQNIKLEVQSDEILLQRDLLMQYKHNIDDSILYASYIQNALLHGDDSLKENFSDCFILYLPRSIIGGDFYFVQKIGNHIIIAAADCTGHGIPGALLSMLGIALLSEIVNRHDIDSTSTILNDMRREVISALSRKDNIYDAKDGMDIALCKINLKTLELQFSGAYNPAFIVRGSELIHLKGDKILVGKSINENRTFTQKNFQLQKNDCLYLFSDGFSDQFGGSTKKKYLMRNFQELLIKIAPEGMSSQKDVLLKTFENWKGVNDQTDDVMILGVRI
ncbi:MAG: SpoIIE family protein phosphatase [Bacteroidales bacterium]|nr:SpoIIE family protein phosphatase [Bacteroidales bacterium]